MSTIKATIIKKQNNINDNNENINNLSICPNSSLRPLSSSPGSLSSLCWNKFSTKMNFQEVSYWPNTTTWSFTSVRTLAASKSVSTGRPLRCLQSVMVESVRNIFITFHAAKSSAPTRRCLRRKLERLPEGFRFSLSEGWKEFDLRCEWIGLNLRLPAVCLHSDGGQWKRPAMLHCVNMLMFVHVCSSCRIKIRCCRLCCFHLLTSE